MRKVLISVAAASAALAVAAPAAAQYYPAPPPPPGYGYGVPPYGNAYGYANRGQVRALQVRIDRIQRDLRRLVQVRAISGNEYRNRNEDARDIERRLRRDARDGRGLTGQEVVQIERRIIRLEQKIGRDIRDRRLTGFGNYYGNYGYGQGYRDRDRDGRDDRYEDDRGWRHD